MTIALGLPALSHTYGHPLISDEINFSRLILKVSRNVLIVDGEPDHVRIWRKAGVKAYGALTEDQKATRWHAVAEPGELPFRENSFQEVFWREQNYFYETGYPWLTDAVRLVMSGGFLLFEEEKYPYWPSMLLDLGWARLPFKIGEQSIYQKGRAKKLRAFKEAA